MPDRTGSGRSDPPEAIDPLWEDWDTPPLVPAIPDLKLDGFGGPLDLLLDLAERERIDLGRIAVGPMVDQFIAALARYERHVPLDRRAEWLILASRLVLLWSRLLLPGTPEAAAARQEAERERLRLQDLQWVRRATDWLDRQPQLGRDVFTRPPGALAPRVASYMRLMEACLTVLERDEAEGPAASEAVALYRIVLRPLFRVSDALARIREHLAVLEAPVPLAAFLPRVPPTAADHDLVCRSAVASTLVAALELARNGEMKFGLESRFEDVSVERNSRI